jgi:hypothetical protein
MRRTLLEIVQAILNDMNSDEVNSIDDTVEATQVASIVRDTYFEMIGNRNWPHLKKLIQLNHVGDLDKPNYLKTPVGLKELEQLRYECLKDNGGSFVMKELRFKYPDEFLSIVSRRNSADANTETIEDFSGSKLLIYSNADPTYWTTFDDEYVVTDSYNKLNDDTLKASKTQAIAYMEPEWLHVDDAVPNLPTEAFPALVEEAKSTCFFVLKQVANQKAEQKASRQQKWLSRKAWKVEGGVRYPDFGRKGRR